MDRREILKRQRAKAAAAFQVQTVEAVGAAMAERERGRALGLDGDALEAHVTAKHRERRATKGPR